MSRLHLDPQALPAELLELQRCLADSLAQLPDAGELPIGATPRVCLLQHEGASLYRYRSQAGDGAAGGPRLRTPLLIVYSLVNRPYVLDLLPGHSLIASLLANGVEVYLFDWGRPQPGDRDLGLDDYLLDRLPAAVQAVLADSGADALSLMGICQGGTLALCFAALRPQPLRQLITVSAPVDCRVDGFPAARLVAGLDTVALANACAQLPGDWLRQFFVSLRPLALGLKKYLDLADLRGRDDALRLFAAMEHWVGDCPNLATAAFCAFIRDCFQDNLLVAGGMRVGGEAVDLRRIRQPVLNLIAERDHLVPPASSRALRGLVASEDYSEAAWDVGHIGLYVSSRALGEVAQTIAGWLRERD